MVIKGPLALSFLLLASGAAAGCGARLEPPRAVVNPAPVALLDHGRHSSLVLGTAEGEMLRYAYGDWAWYALGRTGPSEGSVALLVPSRAALGRRRYAGPLTPQNVERQIRVWAEDRIYFSVERSALSSLIGELDTIFLDMREMEVANESHDLDFVPHPEPYSAWHNSNSVVAEWLTRLGVRVNGPAMLASWRCPTCEVGAISARDGGRNP